MKVIEKLDYRMPSLTLHQLSPGDVFKFASYALDKQPNFLKLRGSYTTLNKANPDLGFINPGEILEDGLDADVVLMSATLTVCLA